MSDLRLRRCLAIEIWPEDQGNDRELTCQYHLWVTSNPVLIGMAADTLTEPPDSALRGFVVLTGSDQEELVTTAQRISEAVEKRRSSETSP